MVEARCALFFGYGGFNVWIEGVRVEGGRGGSALDLLCDSRCDESH